MGEGASRCSFLFKAPYGTSAELCKLCGEGPSGKRGASGRQMDRRMDAWMDGWMEEAELAPVGMSFMHTWRKASF